MWTLLKDVRLVESQTISAGKVGALHEEGPEPKQRQHVQKILFFPPPRPNPPFPSLVFLVLQRQEMSPDIKVWQGSDSLPLLCTEFSTTPDMRWERTRTCTKTRQSYFGSVQPHKRWYKGRLGGWGQTSQDFSEVLDVLYGGGGGQILWGRLILGWNANI